MHVTLLTYTPDPERTVACAARLCYSPAGIDEVMDKLTDEKTASFVDMLAQITRHRIASFSVQSQRYVAENRFDYVLPPEIEALPEAAAVYRQAMEEDQAHYEELTRLLKNKHKQELLASGMEERAADRAAEKRAIEDARFVLPNACTTKMIVTMNARSLLNFFRHRCCNRAQWEIRELAERMRALCVEAAPHLFRHAGPPCLSGPCPEGKMSCGKMREVREKYGVAKER